MNESIFLSKIEQLADFESGTQNRYKLAASVQALRQSTEINEVFLAKKNETEQASVLIHIFGLLQNLFVSIDALYDMSKITTSQKYAVNVNMNKNLHELKYIRNDIVGHPTHRTYQTGGVGFSLMSLDQTTMKEIVYETHFFKNKRHQILKRTINTGELIKDYTKESAIIIKEVYTYLAKEKIEPEISKLAFQFYESLLLETFDEKLLKQIKTDYLEKNEIDIHSNNRLLWRIELLEMLNNWHETDAEKQAFIKYMKLDQAIRIYQMTSMIEEVEPKQVKNPPPNLLQSFFRFIKQDESLLKYVSTLKDYNHPYHDSDLEELISHASNNQSVVKLLNWMERQHNEQRAFTIGSVLEKYKSTQD